MQLWLAAVRGMTRGIEKRRLIFFVGKFVVFDKIGMGYL